MRSMLAASVGAMASKAKTAAPALVDAPLALECGLVLRLLFGDAVVVAVVASEISRFGDGDAALCVCFGDGVFVVARIFSVALAMGPKCIGGVDDAVARKSTRTDGGLH